MCTVHRVGCVGDGVRGVVGLEETGLGGDKTRKVRILHSNFTASLNTQIGLWVMGAS